MADNHAERNDPETEAIEQKGPVSMMRPQVPPQLPPGLAMQPFLVPQAFLPMLGMQHYLPQALVPNPIPPMMSPFFPQMAFGQFSAHFGRPMAAVAGPFSPSMAQDAARASMHFDHPDAEDQRSAKRARHMKWDISPRAPREAMPRPMLERIRQSNKLSARRCRERRRQELEVHQQYIDELGELNDKMRQEKRDLEDHKLVLIEAIKQKLSHLQ